MKHLRVVSQLPLLTITERLFQRECERIVVLLKLWVVVWSLDQ